MDKDKQVSFSVVVLVIIIFVALAFGWFARKDKENGARIDPGDVVSGGWR